MPSTYGDLTYGSGTYGDAFFVVPPPPPIIDLDPTDRFASYKIEVAWSTFIPGIFVVDLSTVGGADTLGAQSFYRYASFGGPLDDITLRADNGIRVDNISWTRGRSDDLAEMQALSATISGRDPTGVMNIHNPNSPLNAGVLATGDLKVLRPVRVTATFQGAVFPIFQGFLRSFDWQPDGRTGRFNLEVTDLFALLTSPRKDQPKSGPFPTIPFVTPSTTGDAIASVLDYVGFDDPGLRFLDVGDALPFFEAVGDKGALDIISDLLHANLGIFYTGKSGEAIFADRNNRYTRPVRTEITNVMRALGSGGSADQIRNKWTVTRQSRTGPGQYTDGVPQLSEDADSQRQYGEKADSLSSPWIATDALAQQLADKLVEATKAPVNPVWQLAIDNRTAELMLAMLSIDLIDRVAVTEAQTGSQGIFFVEQEAGQIDGHHHRVSYILSDRSAIAEATLDPFIVGTDTLDGAKVLSF